MIIVKGTNPDVGYTITPPIVTDSEGSAVPSNALTYEITSDNESAVKITPDPTDPLKGMASFGTPNADGTPSTANVNVKVSGPDGTLLGSFGEQFTVTPGDPAAIVGGTIKFEGLTPA